jgi:hypothetical protein
MFNVTSLLWLSLVECELTGLRANDKASLVRRPINQYNIVEFVGNLLTCHLAILMSIITSHLMRERGISYLYSKLAH